jgi:hypothetical protein
MSVDVHDYSATDPRCKCRQVHGNADTDGICDFCRPKVEAAMEAREKAVGEAFRRLAAQAMSLPESDLERLVSATLRSIQQHAISYTFVQPLRAIQQHGRCRLCRCYGDCAPNCAATMLLEVIDGD